MKKRSFILIFILVALWVLPCVSACALEYACERVEALTVIEPSSEQTYFISGKKVELGQATVYIDDKYSTRAQNAFLRFAEDAMALLAPPRHIRYYVGKGFACRVDLATDCVFLNTDDKTVFLHTTLQLLTAPDVHYGTLWGMSEAIRAQLAGKQFTADHKAAAAILQGNIDILDLTALRFLAPYSTSKEIQNARKVAASFAEWLLRTKGKAGAEELIGAELSALKEDIAGEAFQAFNALFVDLRNEYLSELGLTARVEADKYFVRYTPFSVKYPVCFETDWGVLYFEQDYRNPYANNIVFSEFTKPWTDFSATSVMAIIRTLEETARGILDQFSYTVWDMQPKFDYYLEDAVFYELDLGGYVDVGMREAYVCHFMHFSHEFAHVVETVAGYYGLPVFLYKWMGEGLAEYVRCEFAPVFADFGYAELEYDLTHYSELYGEIYETLRSTVSCDFRAWRDALAYISVTQNMYLDTTNFSYYWRYASFVYWLVDNFGWENFVKVLKDPYSMSAVWGSESAELWRMWGEELFLRAGDALPAPESFLGNIG